MKKPPLTFKRTDLLLALLIACVFVFLSFQSIPLLETLGRIIYGTQMRLDLSQNPGANIISIVNIDDKSLKQIGPWPWPRYVLAEMIPILKSNGAKFVVLDFLFQEKEHHQGLKEIRGLQKAIQDRGGPSPNGSQTVCQNWRKSWTATACSHAP
jgi:CHASE2 domain-containing sensor protein